MNLKNEKGLSTVALIIIIVILIIAVGVAAKFIFGSKGVYENYTEQDTSYNKDEIMEKFNLIIKEKYIKDYKYCNENKLNFADVYSVQAVMQYLQDSGYIEVLKDIDGNDVQDQYYIIPDSLNSDISTIYLKQNGTEGNGTKLFKIAKDGDNYNVIYVDKYGNNDVLGTLNFYPEEQ